MKLTEDPHHPQSIEGNNIFRILGHGIITRITSLFKEDPEIRKAIDQYLTDNFVQEFTDEFQRMMGESYDGAESFGRLVKVNGWGHGEDIFKVLLQEMLPQQLQKLPQPHYAQMITKLSNACGLHSPL